MDFNNTGSNNTAIGYAANVLSGNLINATAIGSNAIVGCSDCMALGGTGADAVRIGVGIATPNASALLDLTSTNKGLLAPRMTTALRTAIGSPAEGLLVFDTTTDSFWFFPAALGRTFLLQKLWQTPTTTPKSRWRKAPTRTLFVSTSPAMKK